MSPQVLRGGEQGLQGRLRGGPQKSAGAPTYIHTYVYVYIYTHTYIHTYIHACIHTCMHACIHTYISLFSFDPEGLTYKFLVLAPEVDR